MWSGSYHVTEETSRFIISSAPEMPSPRTWRQVRPLPDGRALRPTDRWPARRVRHSTPPHSHRPLIEPCQCRALRAHASWRRRPAERENAFVRAHGQKHVRGQKVPMNDRSLYTARTRARKCRLSGRQLGWFLERDVPSFRSVRLCSGLFGFPCQPVPWVSVRFGRQRCNVSQCVSVIRTIPPHGHSGESRGPPHRRCASGCGM